MKHRTQKEIKAHQRSLSVEEQQALFTQRLRALGLESLEDLQKAVNQLRRVGRPPGRKNYGTEENQNSHKNLYPLPTITYHQSYS